MFRKQLVINTVAWNLGLSYNVGIRLLGTLEEITSTRKRKEKYDQMDPLHVKCRRLYWNSFMIYLWMRLRLYKSLSRKDIDCKTDNDSQACSFRAICRNCPCLNPIKPQALQRMCYCHYVKLHFEFSFVCAWVDILHVLYTCGDARTKCEINSYRSCTRLWKVARQILIHFQLDWRLSLRLLIDSDRYIAVHMWKRLYLILFVHTISYHRPVVKGKAAS